MSNEFKYTVDSFADIKVIKYMVLGFDKLSLHQKLYIYYLNEAANSGRDIIWLQKNKDNLVIRKTLENILHTYSGDRDCEDFKRFVVYAKRVFFSNGFTHHYNNNKFYPDVDKNYFIELLEHSDIDKFPISKDMDFSSFKTSIIDILFSKEVTSKDLLRTSITNFYEGVNEKEAKDYYKNLIEQDALEAISHGLNSKLIKKNNQLVEEVYKENGLYGKAISKIIDNLNMALKYAENDSQKKYTKLLIAYYKTGDLSIWDQYSIEWVKSTEGMVDYINGFIEVYLDPIGIKGSWEGIVELVDDEESKITKVIADNALWFEQNSPTDKRFKKTNISGVTAKVVNVTVLAGDSYPSAPIGINLPNSTWIREKYGSKSVSIANLVKAIDNAALEMPKSVYNEFSYDRTNLEEKKKLIILGDNVHTHLHECLGHASGVLLPNVKSNALHEYYSSIEEARADLFALYFMPDSKLIELGVLPSVDVANVFYESYIKGGLQVQLTRLELGQDIVEAHMQARKLISEMAYEMGLDDKVIEKKIKNNKTYFVVNDYVKLRDIFGNILKEIQRIVSEGDYRKAKELIEKYALKPDYDLHKETLERYKKLELKPYLGYVNPNYVLVKDNDKVVDIEIKYVDDFLDQQLDYGIRYSFL